MKKLLFIGLFVAASLSCQKKEQDVCLDCMNYMIPKATHEYLCGSPEAAAGFAKTWEAQKKYNKCYEMAN